MSAARRLYRQGRNASNDEESKDVVHVYSMATDTTVLHRCVDRGKINIRETSLTRGDGIVCEAIPSENVQIFRDCLKGDDRQCWIYPCELRTGGTNSA